MDAESVSALITTVTAIVALGIAIWAVVKAQKLGTPITAELITSSLHEGVTIASEMASVALVGVQAAEQLYRSGKIEQDERFNMAFGYIEEWFPDVDQDLLVTAIESAVLTVNSLVAAMPKKD